MGVVNRKILMSQKHLTKILITGAAGFIGFHTALTYLGEGVSVVGIDNLNDYYTPQLKHDRLSILQQNQNFHFIKMDIADAAAVQQLFNDHTFDVVIHLAAQAGVRYSLENPQAYIDSNITGFLNILEGCRAHPVRHLVYASSSSVYGGNTKMPFSVGDPVDHPISLYAATKRSNELMAYTYAHLFNIPVTGLRFFTVYGPYGRPDMAYFKFANAMVKGQSIDVYNHGDMSRDFTYVDDIVDGIRKLVDAVPVQTPPAAVYNIGNHQPERLPYMIECLEAALGFTAKINYLPMQAGDVPATYADIDDLMALTGFKPKTDLKTGMERFAAWYKDYYKI